MTTRQISRRSALAVVAGAGLSGLAPTALAQSYPDRPVKVVVPFAAGGPTDIMGRVLFQKMTESLGKSFFIENVGGAGGNIGMGQVARSAPDGYTMLFASSTYVVNPSLYSSVPYDAFKDFIPISNVGESTHIFFVHPSLEVKSMKELIDLIKSSPGKYSYASAGSGTVPHLAFELLKLTFGLDISHVPHRGAGPAVQSVVSGHVPIGCTTLPPVSELMKAGQLRGLAVTGSKRFPTAPDVPTMSELGYSGQESSTWQGAFVPAGTPKAVVDTLHAEITKVVNAPGMRERLIELGFSTILSDTAQFTVQIKDEVERWAKVVKDGNIKP